MKQGYQDQQSRLIRLTEEYLKEIGVHRPILEITLQSKLERDLGIDSLGRVELFHRIEEEFKGHLPEKFLGEIECLEDILRILAEQKIIASQNRPSNKIKKIINRKEHHFDSDTLIGNLRKYALDHPDRPHIYLLNEHGEELVITYGALYEDSQKVARGLISKGLKRGQTVAIMLPTSEDFFPAFLGIQLAGGIPVPIYPPFRASKIEEYIKREAKILSNAEVQFLITFEQTKGISKILQSFIPSLKGVFTVDSLKKKTSPYSNNHVLSSDPAMIQYTSGSTGDPKGVLLTHGNIIANLKSAQEVISLKPSDVIVSWLPLYHDMGLIGSWLGSLYFGAPLVLMSPLTFLNRPDRWLWAIHVYRGTLSAAPNFAYELCLKKIKDEDIAGLDLSCWRLALNGAESVQASTLDRFYKRFKSCGLKQETLYPVYGLAESTVALTFPPLGHKPKIDVIDREIFEKQGKAMPSKKNSGVTKIVSCGKPIPYHSVKIVDEKGRELPERKVGTLWFKGPSSMQEYYHNSVATKNISHNSWLDSGDLAYKVDDEIYPVARKKDVIIKAGHNLYPQDIEAATELVSGVRKGCSCAFGVSNPEQGTERLVIVAETNSKEKFERDRIVQNITARISDVLGFPPDEVLLTNPGTIPKTSSGKLQRSACKSAYLHNELKRVRIPLWIQIVKLAAFSFLLKLGKGAKESMKAIYTLYVFCVLLIIVGPFIISIACVSNNLAPKLGKLWSKIILLSCGMFYRVKGHQYLTKCHPTIFVANHASYIDAIVLTAVLPAGTIMIAKEELLHFAPLKWLLTKLGHVSIHRQEFKQSVRDYHKIEDILKFGHSVLIFAEGTFTFAQGIRPFKMGAFQLSIDKKVALCPVSLKGTRQLLRDESYFLTPHTIEIVVHPPIIPTTKGWRAALKLKNIVRQIIGESSGEPLLRH